ncbi:threonine dehydratase [Solimicrobium silvestre]|uniref:Threonine dehydratase n=1 Tax=Solimicrobium silvestre TaxID=2099400 RepID=A0A2S9GWM0_9BURK|nr:threonine dehydratase [Solimicrobium silvestre]PRC92056.1 Threonine dehydratase [Solimicrobium silvestre]
MSLLPSKQQLDAAAQIVYAAMPATPQYSWPLINEALGCEVWIKHENHTPTGAFKMRGGLVYVHELAQRAPTVKHLVSATRGNHGLSVGFAAQRHGMTAHIVVPRGNSTEKNAAMRALGVDLIEFGDDFQDCREHAAQLAKKNDWHMIPSMHPDLLSGVASYWMELFTAQPDLDIIFVPIGQGSGICAAAAAKQALGLKTKIVGVVSAHALAYKSSFEAGCKIEAPVSTKLADGLACRIPDDVSLEIIMNTVDRIVAVTDTEVAAAMKLLFVATHNVAEGAGAAALAAALQFKAGLAGLKVGVPLCGGNVDAKQFSIIIGAWNYAEKDTEVCS